MFWGTAGSGCRRDGKRGGSSSAGRLRAPGSCTETLESASVLGPWGRVLGVISTDRHVNCSGSRSRTRSAGLDAGDALALTSSSGRSSSASFFYNFSEAVKAERKDSDLKTNKKEVSSVCFTV